FMSSFIFFVLYSFLFSLFFFFSSRRRHTRSKRDWSSDVCSSDLAFKCVQVYWHGCCQSLTFTSHHFGDVTVVKCNTTQNLYVERSEERRVGKELRSSSSSG